MLSDSIDFFCGEVPPDPPGTLASSATRSKNRIAASMLMVHLEDTCSQRFLKVSKGHEKAFRRASKAFGPAPKDLMMALLKVFPRRFKRPFNNLLLVGFGRACNLCAALGGGRTAHVLYCVGSAMTIGA